MNEIVDIVRVVDDSAADVLQPEAMAVDLLISDEILRVCEWRRGIGAPTERKEKLKK